MDGDGLTAAIERYFDGEEAAQAFYGLMVEDTNAASGLCENMFPDPNHLHPGNFLWLNTATIETINSELATPKDIEFKHNTAIEGQPAEYTVSVWPATTGLPVTLTIANSLTITPTTVVLTNTLVLIHTGEWGSAGERTLTITAENGYGSVTKEFKFQVAAPVEAAAARAAAPAPAAVAPAAPMSGTLTLAGGPTEPVTVTVTGTGSVTPPVVISAGSAATLTIEAPAPAAAPAAARGLAAAGAPAPESFEKGKGWDAPAGGLLHGVFNNNIMYVVTNGELVVTFNGTDYWGSDADTNGTFDADLGGGDGPWDFTVDDGAGSCESWHFEFGQVPAMIACGA